MNQKYKILIVEKIGDFDYGVYLPEFITRNIEAQNLILAESIQNYLENQGHSVTFRRNLEETTDEEYRNSDIAFIHLTSKRLFRLCELQSHYPNVGLILTTGDSRVEFQELIRDSDGAYILPKPILPETLLKAIEVVKKDRVIHQKELLIHENH